MTFAPDKKTSKSRSSTRTTNWTKLTAKKLKEKVVLNKDATGLAFFISEDGKYNGKKVLSKAKKGKKKTTRI